MTPKQLTDSLKNPNLSSADRIARTDTLTKLNKSDADLAKTLNVPEATVVATKSNASKAWDTLKKNPKYVAAGVTAASLATYMLVTGEKNPAKAAGEMIGEVAAGAGEGIGSGLGGAFKGLLGGLGLGEYLTYIQWGCAACSCLMCFLVLAYIFKTFFK